MQSMHNFMHYSEALAERRATQTAKATPPRRRLGIGLAAWVATAVCGPSRAIAQASPPVQVLAASDLKFALAHLISQYSRGFEPAPNVTYGASGNLARQIMQGLRADIFMSADEALALRVFQAGLAADAGVIYGLGRLVLLAPKTASFALDAQLGGLGQVLQNPPPGFKLAMANPEHAPYGRAAREALQRAGLWERAQQHLVLGDSAAQAAQFVTSGAAAAGLAPHTLALAPELAAHTRFALVSAALHEPLRQRMLLLKGASPAAQRFFAYLQSAPAQALWQRWGLAG